MNPDELQPGDVLLTRSNYLRGKAIRLLDQVPVNHAALYEGKGQIIEALGPGLLRQTFEKSLGPNEYVEVFRHKNAAQIDLSRALEVGSKYVENGGRFALEQIILLAVLISTKPMRHVPALGPLVFYTLRKAASVAAALAEKDVQSMICSEFVFRCFNEVDGPESSKFRIYPSSYGGAKVAFSETGLTLPAPDTSSTLASLLSARSQNFSETETFKIGSDHPQSFEEALKNYEAELGDREVNDASLENLEPHLDSYAKFLKQVSVDPKNASSPSRDQVEFGRPAKAFSNPNWVTPGDLFRSSSLKYVGRLLPEHYDHFEKNHEPS